MNLGDNIYRKYDQDAESPDFASNYLAKYEKANMANKADFYGKQAEEYGKKADASEQAASAQETSNTADLSKIGSAVSKASTPEDAISGGLMASGDPYAMAAGGILKVASMGQQRQQKQMDAERAAFIDRQNRLRDAADKIMSNNFSI